MSTVKAIIGFLLLIIGGGWYYVIYDDVFSRYIDQYIVDSSSPYWLGSNLMWNIVPFVLMLGGVVMLILAGLSRHESGGVVQK